MSTLLQVGWSWYPSVIIGLSLWTLLYAWAIRRGRPTPVAQQIAFHCGTLVALLALLSPLDELGDLYLFSAHMTQHLLLMFVVAPLWLVGTPGWLLDKIVPRRLVPWFNQVLGVVPAFILFVGVMAFWHVPVLFAWAQGSETVHIVEHLTFIGAALIGWWPIAGPDSSRLLKPKPPARMVYTFLLAFPCTALAVLADVCQIATLRILCFRPASFRDECLAGSAPGRAVDVAANAHDPAAGAGDHVLEVAARLRPWDGAQFCGAILGVEYERRT